MTHSKFEHTLAKAHGHMLYLLTLKDGTKKTYPLNVLDKFPKIGTTFQTRLAQFNQVFPKEKVVDWDMIEEIDAMPCRICKAPRYRCSC